MLKQLVFTPNNGWHVYFLVRAIVLHRILRLPYIMSKLTMLTHFTQNIAHIFEND